jgi:hypothetical protein
VQYLVHSVKSSNFTSKPEENKNDSKSLWKSLKNFGLPSKKGSSASSSNMCLKIDETVCSDKKRIVETFNNFYTTVACKLVKKTSLMCKQIWSGFCKLILY